MRPLNRVQAFRRAARVMRDLAARVVSIPPHQYRLLRITWISDICELGGTSSNMLNNAYTAIDTIYLRVRVGWFTRTDVIPLGMGVALAGPSHGIYNGPGPYHGSCF